jgi:hypothetical protein
MTSPPGDARIAVELVLNNECAESSLLHGDRASEAFLSKICGAKPRPGVRDPNRSMCRQPHRRRASSRPYFWAARGATDGICIRLTLERNLKARPHLPGHSLRDHRGLIQPASSSPATFAMPGPQPQVFRIPNRLAYVLLAIIEGDSQ